MIKLWKWRHSEYSSMDFEFFVAWFRWCWVISCKYDKSTKFNHSIIKILHWMLPYTLTASKNTSRHVSVRDLVLLKAAIDGRQMHLTKWLIHKIFEIRDEKVEIQFRWIVTFIAISLQVSLEESDKAFIREFKANQWIKIDALSKMRLIEKVQGGRWRLILAKGNKEENQPEDE